MNDLVVFSLGLTASPLTLSGTSGAAGGSVFEG